MDSAEIKSQPIGVTTLKANLWLPPQQLSPSSSGLTRSHNEPIRPSSHGVAAPTKPSPGGWANAGDQHGLLLDFVQSVDS